MRDLGLSYEAALHGVQSAVRYEMTKLGIPDDDKSPTARFLKHTRVGADSRAADMGALATLLIGKNVITRDEYLEAIRLAANEELQRYQEHLRTSFGLPDGAEFR
jgi:hypothetical protein